MAKLVDQMMKDVLGNVLEKLEHYKESKSDIENEIDSAIDMLEKEIKEEFVSDGKAWDFSKERGEAVFAEDDEIFLCPITEEYYEAYFKTRKEYLTLNIFEKFNVTVDDFFWPGAEARQEI